jgi:hypothetical protein
LSGAEKRGEGKDKYLPSQIRTVGQGPPCGKKIKDKKLKIKNEEIIESVATKQGIFK